MVRGTEVIMPERIRDAITSMDPPPDTITIIPDGDLYELPFEALLLQKENTHEYLLDNDEFPPIAYAPSLLILDELNKRLQKRREKQHPSPPRLLSVAPVYGQEWLEQASLKEPLFAQLTTLYHNKQESRDISDLFTQPGFVRTLVGVDATEATFRNELETGDYSFVHLAAHGFTNKKMTNLPGGIALTPSLNEDWLLELDEIYQMSERKPSPLYGCELAVLSACQSNVGRTTSLEMGESLARAFMSAGAKRVVSSQWKVDDKSTAAFMKLLFERIIENVEKGQPVNYAQALRDARQEVRKKEEQWNHPHHWAPFVLVGLASE